MTRFMVGQMVRMKEGLPGRITGIVRSLQFGALISGVDRDFHGYLVVVDWNDNEADSYWYDELEAVSPLKLLAEVAE